MKSFIKPVAKLIALAALNTPIVSYAEPGATVTISEVLTKECTISVAKQAQLLGKKSKEKREIFVLQGVTVSIDCGEGEKLTLAGAEMNSQDDEVANVDKRSSLIAQNQNNSAGEGEARLCCSDNIAYVLSRFVTKTDGIIN
ncbi:TPA: hypothetical protein ACS72K_003857 [Providencia alcalifaciens]